ncbi:LysR substrate-binding domain-containing protein [Gayadomonas joobiniege]|uniref:LysR substrate-binding domain-containing protein n=1 Tax=Gayadomonas joobiniege TaxID=1234606 RepID=UPI00037BB13E|nr:LysR substrate-binding domain-containing protein [Gayadomonas joobiniege]
MLEIKHLKTMRALAQTGSLTKTAQWLHTTTSALSHQLKELEQRIGQPLYVRKTNPLKFTAEGELVLALAESILPQIQETEARILDMQRTTQGQLRLAIECHSCFQWLMPAIRNFHKNWPMVELDFNSDYMFDAMPGLTEGDLDLVITSDRYPSDLIHFEPLFDFEMLLVCSPEHKLAKQKSIQPSDLSNQTLLTYPVAEHRLDIYKHFLLPANCQPGLVKKVDQTLMILQMVTADLGVAALPAWAVLEYQQQGLIATCKLGEQGLYSKLYAAVKTRMLQQNYIRAFFDISRSVSLLNLKDVRPLTE